MGLTAISIRRPLFITMFVLALVILGVRARSSMPKEQMPDTDAPYVTISTTYSGAGPEEVETLVTKPIEDAVASVNGLKHITSSSREGSSVISLEFYYGTNVDTAASDTRDKVSGVRGELPTDASEPTVSKLNVSGQAVIEVGINGSLEPRRLRKIADSSIKDAFAKIPGAAAVSIQGGEDREIQVNVDKNKLQAYGLSLSQVVSAINAKNQNQPGGSIDEKRQQYSVRLVGEFTDIAQIKEIRIPVSRSSGQERAFIRLNEIATVADSVADADTIIRIGIDGGAPETAVLLSVQKQSGANTVEVVDGVKIEMARLLGEVYDSSSGEIRNYDARKDGGFGPPARILPTGVNMVVTTDQSVKVRDSLNDVNHALVEGVLLVVLIVFLFLHSGRGTFIVALAIPTSMFATFLPIHAMGYTLNTMTLLGLSLAVGILVDDSIVVLENIERHLRRGESPKEAAINGRSEIGLAAIAITMVDVVVFVPIAMMSGMTGQIFRSFGWTVAIATLFSLLVSFTLTPMLASRLLKGERNETAKEGRSGFWAGIFRGFDRFYDQLDQIYESVLAWTLDNRLLTIMIGWAALFTVLAMLVPASAKPVFAVIVALAIGIGIAFSRDKRIGFFMAAELIVLVFLIHLPLSFEFFPSSDDGEFKADVEARAGQSLQVTDETIRKVGDVIRNLKDPKTGKPIIKYVILTTGATGSNALMGSGDSGDQYGSISAKLVDKRERSESTDDVVRRVTALTSMIPGAKLETQSSGTIGGSKPITEEVTGSDLDQNVKVSEALIEKMKKTSGVVNVDSSWKTGTPEVQIKVDEAKAADLGVDASTVINAARLAYQGSGDGASDTKYREHGDQYVIRVRYRKLDRGDSSQVGDLIIASNNGRPIHLKDAASLSMGASPNVIKRKDRQRLISVEAGIGQGYSQGNVQQAVNQAAQSIDAGSSRVSVGGMGAMQTESMGALFTALGLAVMLVYMLMSALFENLTTPFVIWLSLPQALIGGLLGLMLTNKSLNMVSMIGIIMLMGLVTKNAILLIDYANTLRARGKDRRSAILEAGSTRLRPVLMTTLAMVGGMLPTALAVSQGSEQRQPLAIVVIGGLLLSTMLTLLVIPVTYTLMDDMVSGVRSRWLDTIGRHRRHSSAIEKVSAD